MAGSIKSKSFYDATKTYDDNFDNGPFPVFDDEQPESETGEPKFTFLGKPLYSPFGIAAGPLLNSRYIKYAFERGFDVPVYKTQRSIPFEVNQFPNILYVDTKGDLTMDKAAGSLVGLTETNAPPTEFSITNSFGNPSRGPEFWVEDLKKAHSYQGRGQLLIGGAVGSIQEGFSGEDYYDDFAYAAELVASTGVEAVEVNLSCPNVASEGVLCYTKPAVVAICQKVKNKIGDVPLVIKLGYFSADQQDLLEQILKETADYVSAVASINTIPAAIVDHKGEQALPGPNRLKSGVCGAGIKWAGLDMTSRLNAFKKKAGLKYEVIGIGGVMTPADFHEYLDAGANLVQSCTGAMWNPKLAIEIKQYLAKN
jgi:dihydroorotate dehydrogenase (NAD+) catalytic subunit